MNFTLLTKRIALLVVAGAGLTGTSAGAANLAEIYELAVKNDPQLAAAEAQFLGRKETVIQARAGLLPTVTASMNTSSNDQTGSQVVFDGSVVSSASYNSNNWSATLIQPVFNMARWFQFHQSRDVEAQAAATFAGEQQSLIFRVADGYLSILEAHDALSSANAERDAVQRQLEQVQQRFDVGLVAITDVLESTAAFDSSTVNVIEAEGTQVTSFERLLRLTGQPFSAVNGLSPDFPVDYPEPRDEEAWVAAAIAGNYNLIAAMEGVDSAHRGLHIAQSGHLPTVDARLTYNESNSGIRGGSANTSNTATLSLNVPVFSGLATSSRVKQSGYELLQAERNLDVSRRTVVEDTRTLYTAVITDVARVKARLRGIESSQSALDAVQTGYEVGTRNIVDVLVAQRNLFQAQFQYASARYRFIRDTLRLKQMTGALSPDDVYQLNNFVAQSAVVNRTTPSAR
jgi:outer membrane protein